ncbi:hypothetical protein EJB05_18068, partial [Eragrostis curvula]
MLRLPAPGSATASFRKQERRYRTWGPRADGLPPPLRSLVLVDARHASPRVLGRRRRVLPPPRTARPRTAAAYSSAAYCRRVQLGRVLGRRRRVQLVGMSGLLAVVGKIGTFLLWVLFLVLQTATKIVGSLLAPPGEPQEDQQQEAAAARRRTPPASPYHDPYQRGDGGGLAGERAARRREHRRDGDIFVIFANWPVCSFVICYDISVS